jgi:hypothetical protein
MLPPSRFPDSAPLPRPTIALSDLEPPALDRIATEPARERVLLPWAVKLSLLVALLGFGTSQSMTWLVGAAAVQREARLASGLSDPETTGSISSAADVRLDPCAVPPRLKGGR